MAKIGVKAKIVSYEWGEYLKRAKNREPQTVMIGWTGDNGDPDNFLWSNFEVFLAKQSYLINNKDHFYRISINANDDLEPDFVIKVAGGIVAANDFIL